MAMGPAVPSSVARTCQPCAWRSDSRWTGPVGVLDRMAVGAAAAWAYLVAGHGGFWRMRARLPVDAPAPECWAPVTVIVPARDEAMMLPRTLPSLLAQDYAGELAVWMVDDGSTDGTA